MKSLDVDILIIGAGQSGLTAGYYLRNSRKKVLIIDAGAHSGDSWKNRYDCLRLLTPRYQNGLPGLKLVGNPNDLLTKDEYAKYLIKYAKKLALPTLYKTRINELTFKNGLFFAKSKKYNINAKQVIIATGPFQKPFIPSFARNLSKKVFQIHSASFRNFRQLKKGSVLIVGAGSSGSQIAVDLTKTHRVTLSANKKMFKTSRFDFIYRLIAYFLSPNTIRGIVNFLGIRKIQEEGLSDLLESGEIKLRPKLVDISRDLFKFESGRIESFDNVLWSTGYEFDFSWIKIPEIFEGRDLIEEKINKNGLFFVYSKRDYGFIRDLPQRIQKIIKPLNEKN